MENEINKIIGKNLLNLRKQKKLTQLELAEKLNYSDKSISKWEKGESLPSIEILYELAKFYGISLDALVSSENICEQTTPRPKSRREKYFPAKLCITLLATSAIWLVSTVLFVSLKLGTDKNFYILFLWSVPASCIMLIIFNSIWGRPKWLFIILTVLIWSFIASLHIQMLEYNIWPIYFLGIPLQVAVILSLALTRPRGYKVKKEKPIKEKKQKIKKEKHKLANEKPTETTSISTESTTENSNTNNQISDSDMLENYNQNFEQPKSEGRIEVSLPQISKMPNNSDKK